MRISKHFVVIVIFTLLLQACGTSLTGYSFDTKAVYMAPVTGLKYTLSAQGNVPAGQDVGEGKVSGTILITNKSVTIDFTYEKMQLKSLLVNNEEQSYDKNEGWASNMTSLLIFLDINPISTEEIEELEKVIEGASCGPKGTYMEGQTEFLEVSKVSFTRH